MMAQPVMMQQQQQPVMKQQQGCCTSCCSYTEKQSKCFQKTVPVLFLSTIVILTLSLVLNYAYGHKLIDFFERQIYISYFETHDVYQGENRINIMIDRAHTIFGLIIASII